MARVSNPLAMSRSTSASLRVSDAGPLPSLRARARSRHDADETAERLARALPPHDAYEVLVRTRVSFAEHELSTVRTRLHLFVEAHGRRGVTLRARVFRLGSGEGAPDAFSDVEVELDRRGGITHDPLSLCDDPDVDDLSPARVVRHVLGSLAPWDGAGEGSLALDVSEIAAPVRFRYRRRADGILARASGTARLGSFAIAGWRFGTDGAAQVRADERLDPEDALSVRSRLTVEVIATATDVEGRTRMGVLEIRSDVVSRPATLEPSEPATCASDFPRDHMVRVGLRADE